MNTNLTLPNRCFVAYPFQDPFDRYFRDLYFPAIENAGLQAITARDIFAAGDVIRQIAAAIRDSIVVLADLSLPNANVYYEVGLAHAWGKPVVLTTQAAESVPFDLRGGRLHIYDKDDPAWGNSLVTSVTKSLIETVKDPLACLPSGFATLQKSSAEGVEEGGGSPDSAWMRSIEEHLGQLQRSIEVSTRPITLSPASLAQAESARELIRVLRRGNVPDEEIVAQLIAAGSSRLWAQDAVRSVRQEPTEHA